MSMALAVYRLFGLISMTPVLWLFFLAQTALVLLGLRLCLLPIKDARRGQRLMLANGLAIPLTFAISALSYVASMYQAFRATTDAPPNDKALMLAEGISNTMHLMWLWIPFAVILGILFGVQIARQREAASLRSRE